MNTSKPYEGYIIQSECGRLYVSISKNADIMVKKHRVVKQKTNKKEWVWSTLK